MSRSIHHNRTHTYRWQKGGWDPMEQFKKSTIKRLVRAERSAPDRVEHATVTSNAIRYSVEELPPGLFFPATLDDVKGVLDELPPGMLDGVRHIEFLSGRETINAEPPVEGEVLDPVAGRRSVEIAEGVYAPILLGTFDRELGEIQLFAYAAAPADSVNENCELALKLHMLQTLVHELAHNEDQSRRVARGRWRMDDEDKAEAYADRRMSELFKAVVLPYAARVYGPSSDDG